MHRVRVFLSLTLDTVDIMVHFMMRPDVAVLKASFKVGVIALVWGHFRKVWYMMYSKIVTSLTTEHLLVVLGCG